MAEALFRAWLDRARGRLLRRPCPYAFAWVLDLGPRKWVAGPEKVLDGFALEPGERVLELGPGTGYYTTEMARRVGTGGRLLCLDIQHEMLAATRQRLGGSSPSPVAFVQGDAERLPLRSGIVDRAVLVAVLGEIPNRRRALEELRRVLIPGGRLSVCEQFPDPDFVSYRTLCRELTELGFSEETKRGRLVYTSTWRAPSE